jgi:hypothetical protein
VLAAPGLLPLFFDIISGVSIDDIEIDELEEFQPLAFAVEATSAFFQAIRGEVFER